MFRFVFGDWYEYFTAMNYVKSYYGEKYAFEFAFLVHYQAWLMIPAIAGFGVLATQILDYLENGDINAVIDSKYNGIYGFFVSIWSSIFIASWRKKQAAINFYWDVDRGELDKEDERVDEFKSNLVYNFLTQTKEKIQQKSNPSEISKYDNIGRLYLFIVTLVLVTYIVLDGFFTVQDINLQKEIEANPDKVYTSS